MKKHQIIIAGGGAAGTLCAILAGQAGLDVAIMEAQDRILKKLLVTGNGRCNISNEKLTPDCDFGQWYSLSQGTYDFAPLRRFDVNWTKATFQSLGIPLRTLEDGKLYPLSLQASSVSDLLRQRLKELKVPVYLNSRIRSVRKVSSGYQLTTPTDMYESQAVVVASGGQAMPVTGSDGSFYKILRELSLSPVAPLPALVQLKTDFKQARAISGVKQDARLTLTHGGKELMTTTGELLFTDYGLSGIPILQLSRLASPLLAKGETPRVHINLFPDYTEEDLARLIREDVRRFPHREAATLLNGILNKKLIPVLFKLAGLDKMTRPVKDLEAVILDNLLGLLGNWTHTLVATTGFGNAQSTLGGLAMDQVKETLEVKSLPNFYCIGEVLDVCGACGGYNLQWAWASAATVADALVKKYK